MSSSSACQFWLTNDAGSDKIQLPVLPEKITITHDSRNDSVSVAGLGEITILQDPTEKSFSFSSHFPAVPHQASIANPMEPQRYIDKIEEWRASLKPVKFIITGSSVNLFCSIESFSYYEQGGDPDTLYYDIGLKEYRSVTARQLDTTPTVQPVNVNEEVHDPVVKPETKTEYKEGKVKTNGGRLMLRSSATTSSSVLVKMPNGSKLQIISKTGNWYKVIYNGKTGYAYAGYVK